MKKNSFVRINLLLSTKRKHFKWIWEPLHLRLIIHKGMAMEEMGSIVYNKSLCAETGRVVHVYYFHITFLNSLHFQKMHQSFRVLIMNYPKYIQSPGYFYVYKTIRNVRQKSVLTLWEKEQPWQNICALQILSLVSNPLCSGNHISNIMVFLWCQGTNKARKHWQHVWVCGAILKDKHTLGTWRWGCKATEVWFLELKVQGSEEIWKKKVWMYAFGEALCTIFILERNSRYWTLRLKNLKT